MAGPALATAAVSRHARVALGLSFEIVGLGALGMVAGVVWSFWSSSSENTIL